MPAIHLPLAPEEKLSLLGRQMNLEPAEDSAQAMAPCGHSPAELRRAVHEPATEYLTQADANRQRAALGIHPAAMPGGKQIALLKTMLTSACERDCFYCPFRAGRNYQRATFKPEEMAHTFSQLHRAGLAQGLFLSSGLAGGGVRTQDRLLDTAAILRQKSGFRGYLHLKLMPGSERDQVLRAMQLADRISINLEAPNAARLSRLAPHKVFLEELLRPLQWAEEIRRSLPPQDTVNGRWPSTVTQLVVGGAGEDDLEILTTTEQLMRQLRLRRVYFSAFHPVPDTPLENQAAEDPWRQHRLYQASFLLRDYGFDLEDLPFSPGGRLPLDMDPKRGWAEQNLRAAPLELNRAERRDLLRVPGFGPQAVESVLKARRRGTLRELRDLERLGIAAARAAPFILLNGRRPNFQMALFAM